MSKNKGGIVAIKVVTAAEIAGSCRTEFGWKLLEVTVDQKPILENLSENSYTPEGSVNRSYQELGHESVSYLVLGQVEADAVTDLQATVDALSTGLAETKKVAEAMEKATAELAKNAEKVEIARRHAVERAECAEKTQASLDADLKSEVERRKGIEAELIKVRDAIGWKQFREILDG
jgi:hypothetical protein